MPCILCTVYTTFVTPNSKHRLHLLQMERDPENHTEKCSTEFASMSGQEDSDEDASSNDDGSADEDASSNDNSSAADDDACSDEDSRGETRLDVDTDFVRNELESSMSDDIHVALDSGSGAYMRERIAFTILLYFLLVWKSFYALLFVLYNVLNFLGISDIFKKCFGFAFPKTMYMLRKFMKLDRNDFERYVVCQTCYKLFTMEECKVGTEVCDNRRFKKGKFAKACGTDLGYHALLKDGSRAFFPHKVYCYKSVINSLKTILNKPQSEQDEQWRQRKIAKTEMGNVFDGNIWKKIQIDGFFSLPHSYGIMLNCDWFQPFDRRTDISIGVIYVALLNLPRKTRFLRKNIIIIGIIPAMNKEPSTLNSFLNPFVKELKVLYNGIQLKTHLHPGGTNVRAALICVSADIPALRKLCGFLGHNATLGCSKCYKIFSGRVSEQRTYGRFDTRQSGPQE